MSKWLAKLCLLVAATGLVVGPMLASVSAQQTEPVYWYNNGTLLTACDPYQVNFLGGVSCTGNKITVPVGAGGVTSIACGAGMTCTPASPISTSGTIALTTPVVIANGGTGAATTSANFVFIGPTSGIPAAPSFRALVAGDIPSLSGTYLPLAGGTMSGAITLSGTQLGTYSLGGTPTLAATLALGGQTLSGNGTFSGAITASGTASFDLSGGSGVFKTTTGAVTIGTGTATFTGPIVSSIGGTSSVPISITGVASRNGIVYSGIAPAPVSGNGTAAGSILSFTGAAGGATSGTTGQIAGAGEGVSLTLGAGGTAPGGSTNGAGGSFLVIPGAAGGGAGAAGGNGTATFKAPAATYGNVLQVQSSVGDTNFAVSDVGVLSLGLATKTSGNIKISGATSGTITIQPQAAAGTYFLNLPNTVGSAGSILLSEGGGSSAQQWLPSAAAGQVLTSNGAGADPMYSPTPTVTSVTATTGMIAAAYSTNNATSTLLISAAAPTVFSGFGTSPSISAKNGTAAFRIDVGAGGVANTGAIGLPAAATGWNCYVTDLTTPATNTKQTASTTTTATITSYNSAGNPTAWATNAVLAVSCFAY